MDNRSGWTAIIVNYNGAGFLEACLSALAGTDHPPQTTIVVDNASSDDSLMELRAFPRVEILAQTQNLGFAGGANAGLRATTTDIAVVVNPDVEVASSFGTAVMNVFARIPMLGAAGTLMTYPGEDRIQHAGGIIDRPTLTTRHRGYGDTRLAEYAGDVDVDFVTGGAIALNVAAVRSIDGFDEQFSPVYYEDVDLCVRLRAAGWRVMLTPSLAAVHHEGVTLKREIAYYRHLHRNRIRFALKHLDQTEWAHEFVPAELDRLRHALAIAQSRDDAEISGAAAIEEVLRGVAGVASWSARSIIPGWPEPDPELAKASGLIDVAGVPPRSRIPGMGWIRNKINELGPRWYVDPAFERQSAFNAAIVRVLDAHQRLHREQTAGLLLIAMDVLGWRGATPHEGTAVRPEASESE